MNNKSEVKALAIKKWEWIVKNWDYNMGVLHNDNVLNTEVPEIRGLMDSCSFCEYYSCKECPLYDDADSLRPCAVEYYKYRSYAHACNKRWGTYWAKKLLKRIRAIKISEM